jgi:adenylate kinase
MKRILANRIGITGSPATGKKSVAIELSKITGLEPFSINDYAISKKLGHLRNGEYEIDVKRLKGIETTGKIIYGHLLPYVVSSSEIDFVAVLRCSPVELRKRYERRGYGEKKIQDNLESEVLGLLSFKSLERYGKPKVGEFDTSRASPKTIANLVLETVKGNIPRRFGDFDWLRTAKSAASLLRILSPNEGLVRGKG